MAGSGFVPRIENDSHEPLDGRGALRPKDRGGIADPDLLPALKTKQMIQGGGIGKGGAFANGGVEILFFLV
jgi:hypothetical protein